MSTDTLIDELQRLTPDVDVAAVLGERGHGTLSDVRRDLVRAGVDQAEIDRLIPADDC